MQQIWKVEKHMADIKINETKNIKPQLSQRAEWLRQKNYWPIYYYSIMEKFQTFFQLTRLSNPTGFMLLFWPCVWGLTLAYYFGGETALYLKHIILFFLGSVLGIPKQYTPLVPLPATITNEKLPCPVCVPFALASLAIALPKFD